PNFHCCSNNHTKPSLLRLECISIKRFGVLILIFQHQFVGFPIQHLCPKPNESLYEHLHSNLFEQKPKSIGCSNKLSKTFSFYISIDVFIYYLKSITNGDNLFIT